MKLEAAIQQKKFASEHHRASLNILYTAEWLHAKSKPVFRRYGITQPQFNVLRILRGRHPEACSVSEIKEVMLFKSPDLTRMLDRLVEKGLVERETCPSNRRKVDLRITAEGTRVAQDAFAALEKEFAGFFADHISVRQARQLSDLLDRFRGAGR